MIEKVVTRGGKPFQSKLAPYEAELMELKANGVSVRAIAEEMRVRHGLTVKGKLLKDHQDVVAHGSGVSLAAA